ncbi:site-specific integrase [Vagococcus sp. PNs007]|uniref:Site-specific integrase n=1 Tax=Vagococcus proximus TaxID=2991417 RepID=A0ABT5X0Y4_9ENTE|nr:site-specific integrase [Vagococcus proximus]MDF0479655.1 site-specific integrase [Vagococcus proximus]
MSNVYKDKATGKYYFSASIGYDSVTGKRIRSVKRGFLTERDAKKAYHQFMNDYGDMAFKTNTTMSYKEYFESIFLPWYKGRVKKRTYDNRLSTMLIHFKTFNRTKLSEISPIQIQKWQNKMLETQSNSYTRNIFGLFSMSLERAVLLGMLVKNPAKVVGNVKKKRVEVSFWTLEEFEKVIATFDKSDYYEHFSFVVIWLFFMTGLRLGEGQALTWKTDIDLENCLLKVTKSMFYQNLEEFEIVPPKTPSSIRTLALDSDTVEVLKEWKVVQDGMGGSDYVLSYNGIPTNKHTVRHIIRRHSSLADINDIRIHGLRHSHASLLISLGENALIIKDRLGHADIQTTLGTYGHLYPNSNLEVANKLTGLVSIDEEVNVKKRKFNGNQYLKKEGK